MCIQSDRSRDSIWVRERLSTRSLAVCSELATSVMNLKGQWQNAYEPAESNPTIHGNRSRCHLRAAGCVRNADGSARGFRKLAVPAHSGGDLRARALDCPATLVDELDRDFSWACLDHSHLPARKAAPGSLNPVSGDAVRQRRWNFRGLPSPMACSSSHIARSIWRTGPVR